jgi:ATP-dependent Clp protease protease subunit
MDKIDVSAPAGERKERFFARAAGTKFTALVDGGNTTIDLYDEIGYWGVDAKTFRSRLKDAAGDITLRINSGGGDVFDGISIYNDLIAYEGKVRVEVTGLAASIASIIAMAGDEIVMAPNAFMMIHDAWTIGIGNRHDFGTLSATLSKIDDALARTYAARSTTGIRAIKDMMDKETWLTASEAVDAGFATSVSSGASAQDGAKAKFDLSVFGQVPESLLWKDADLEVETEEDIEKLLMRDAGKTRSQARSLIRDIRAGTTSKPETKPGAGGVELSNIAAAITEARAAFHNIRT